MPTSTLLRPPRPDTASHRPARPRRATLVNLCLRLLSLFRRPGRQAHPQAVRPIDDYEDLIVS
jgi:hypothetical protein